MIISSNVGNFLLTKGLYNKLYSGNVLKNEKNLDYNKVQERPDGLAQAFIICKEFIGKDSMYLCTAPQKFEANPAMNKRK